MVLLVTLFLVSISTAFAQTTTNLKEAQQWAQEQNRPILLVFSGSDWCQPCMRLDKYILQEEAFQAFAQKELVVLKCDFPQRKRLPEGTLQQNEALAERFNPKGAFPKVLLLDPTLQSLGEISYNGQDIPTFLQQINTLRPKKTGLQEYRRNVPLMGSFFEFIVVAPKHAAPQAELWIDGCVAEAERIEALLSEWQPDSEISRLNRQAGQGPMTVSQEVYDLLKRSCALGALTQGAFDLTFLSYYDYWSFGPTPPTPPFDTARIQALSKRVDYRHIQLLPQRQVQLPAHTKIGTGGIGQGYAVDRIREYLLTQGVQDFVINSSGDVYAHGRRADGSPWKVGIASPLNRDQVVQWLPVENFAVVTSGTSEKNFEHQGTIYGHIINTKTGFPVEGLQSVTVMSTFTEVADALATSILVLGPEIGLDLVNQMPNTHCIIIDAKQNIHYSDGLDLQK